MKKECIVCKNPDEMFLKIIEYNITSKFWMCQKCIGNENGEWEKAKQAYCELKGITFEESGKVRND